MKTLSFIPTLLVAVSLLIPALIALTPQNPDQIHLALHHHQAFLNNLINLNNTQPKSHSSESNHAGNSPSLNRNPFIKRQVAAGGGLAATTLPPSQYPTVTYAGSLYTIGTSTGATWKEFTQTFAATALGTWALGPTPRAGTIGLGTLHGKVGVVKSDQRKAVQTSSPQV